MIGTSASQIPNCNLIKLDYKRMNQINWVQIQLFIKSRLIHKLIHKETPIWFRTLIFLFSHEQRSREREYNNTLDYEIQYTSLALLMNAAEQRMEAIRAKIPKPIIKETPATTKSIKYCTLNPNNTIFFLFFFFFLFLFYSGKKDREIWNGS